MTTTVTPVDTRFDLEPVRQLTPAERRPVGREIKITTRATINADDERPSAERQAALADQVALLVARGRRVEYEGHFDTVLVRGQRSSHGLDRLPKFLTGLFGGEQRESVVVDKSGNVAVSDE